MTLIDWCFSCCGWFQPSGRGAGTNGVQKGNSKNGMKNGKGSLPKSRWMVFEDVEKVLEESKQLGEIKKKESIRSVVEVPQEVQLVAESKYAFASSAYYSTILENDYKNADLKTREWVRLLEHQLLLDGHDPKLLPQMIRVALWVMEASKKTTTASLHFMDTMMNEIRNMDDEPPGATVDDEDQGGFGFDGGDDGPDFGRRPSQQDQFTVSRQRPLDHYSMQANVGAEPSPITHENLMLQQVQLMEEAQERQRFIQKQQHELMMLQAEQLRQKKQQEEQVEDLEAAGAADKPDSTTDPRAAEVISKDPLIHQLPRSVTGWSGGRDDEEMMDRGIVVQREEDLEEARHSDTPESETSMVWENNNGKKRVI
eukprot:CAMPEP_0184692464 /NCGR_PEP_ID=MMETSP0313-20130426/938_1 /TAXON_ID=2792 /ORGANISM="Porphyridium aerugineum, Strain SAG 1380-2" /LENGTH=368 /DNA_ID=CAMNT_0027150299 /DNA_START=83 /DNA_END=1189 /DNA_ORIENTATION=-